MQLCEHLSLSVALNLARAANTHLPTAYSEAEDASDSALDLGEGVGVCTFGFGAGFALAGEGWRGRALGRDRGGTGEGAGDSESDDMSACVQGRAAYLNALAKVTLTRTLISGLALTIFLQLRCPQANEANEFSASLSFEIPASVRFHASDIVYV